MDKSTDRRQPFIKMYAILRNDTSTGNVDNTDKMLAYLNSVHSRLDLLEDVRVLVHGVHPHAHAGGRQRYLENRVRRHIRS